MFQFGCQVDDSIILTYSRLILVNRLLGHHCYIPGLNLRFHLGSSKNSMFTIAKTLFALSFAAYIADCSCRRDRSSCFRHLPYSYKGIKTFVSLNCSETRTTLKLISRLVSGVFAVSFALLGSNSWNSFSWKSLYI